MGRVEGTGRNPFTSRLEFKKVQVNLSLPCTGVAGLCKIRRGQRQLWKFQSGFDSETESNSFSLGLTGNKYAGLQLSQDFITTEKSYQPVIATSVQWLDRKCDFLGSHKQMLKLDFWSCFL